jgi:hypothetical protein
MIAMELTRFEWGDQAPAGARPQIADHVKTTFSSVTDF